MNLQDLIQAILGSNPSVTREQLMQQLEDQRVKTGGLLGDETILRLIAARHGVKVPQNSICHNGILSSKHLFAGLNDVTVAGRLVAVFPVRTFEGEKPGKFASMLIVDEAGVLRVMLWNEKADLIEKGELKAGQAVRLLHGYTREDRFGKVELHLGSKSQIELEPPEKSCQYPPLEKFSTKIGSLNKISGTVHLCGFVKQILGSSIFTRSDATEGTLLRFVLADDSGQVTVVAWNEKAAELTKIKHSETRLQLVNAHVKEGINGVCEVHVDQGTFIVIEAKNKTKSS